VSRARLGLMGLGGNRRLRLRSSQGLLGGQGRQGWAELSCRLGAQSAALSCWVAVLVCGLRAAARGLVWAAGVWCVPSIGSDSLAHTSCTHGDEGMQGTHA
jgi:hypothetical protein